MAEPAIIASYWTIAGNHLPHAPNRASPISLETRVAAAARAGFSGMGFDIDDIAISRARLGDAAIRKLFADHGMRWIELEALIDWFADGERRERSDVQRSMALDQARALGAFQIKVVGDIVGDCPADRMAEEFATLCRQAAVDGIRVTIELLPFSNIASIPQALAVVGSAGANAGLLFDSWHVARGHIPLEEIAALPPGLCAGIELDDGPAEPAMDDLYTETVNCRSLPGQGEFDLTGLIRAARSAGFTGPYGVEILSPQHRTLPVEEAARVAYDATYAALMTALPDHPSS